MTTLQPRLVRADTLDLQDQNAPSAKDHTRSPTFSPYQNGTGPHHREALRNAEESAYHDRQQNPRVSVDETHTAMSGQTHLYDSAEDSADEEQHDGTNGVVQHDADYENGEVEEGEEEEEDVDDDLLDKISSSPSIEDGKYPSPLWPKRMDSLEVAPAQSASPTRGISLSVPYPSLLPKEMGRKLVNHHHGEYGKQYEDDSQPDEKKIGLQNSDSIRTTISPDAPQTSIYISGSSYESCDDIKKYLLPDDDPFLDDASDDTDCSVADIDDEEADWIDEEVYYQYYSSSDDDTEDFIYTPDSRFIDSGWGGECLRETEDIDFEFVYALHTFVATVEGQANATKGDTMVLLDDSNSYWWLVRVVKDGSIGYLPAEHIETPTERLARLNKHRNIDLSASMLGDNPEKSKNPLKKAMRRRNAKTVAFTAPIFYEPSLYDYTSDEDEEELELLTEEDQQKSQQAISEEVHVVEDGQAPTTNGIQPIAGDEQILVEGPSSPVKAEAPSISEPQSQALPEENIQRSRNGVVRNTDSFFKDDTVETKKISLTPRLLRNDTDSSHSVEPERSSMETVEKVVSEEKNKEDKKKKEKKGMLSGLFKRKDKKSGKGEAEEIHSPEDSVVSPRAKDSMESLSATQPERKQSKLQKSPRGVTSPKMSPVDAKAPNINGSAATTPTSATPVQSPQLSISPGGPSEARSNEPTAVTVEQPRTEQTPNRFPSLTEKRSIFSPITTVLKSNTSGADATSKPVYAKKAKERFAIDGSDSEDDSTPTTTQRSLQHRSISPMRESRLYDSRPDSAMQVSPLDSHDGFQDSDQMLQKTVSLEDSTSPTSNPGQSDTASTSKPSPSLAAHTPSTSRSTPTWSDASLRSYMDNDQDIRDLLIIVHDKSNVIPVGPEHPLMGGLFMTERTRLAEMQTQLDTMLTSWISKKNPGLLAK